MDSMEDKLLDLMNRDAEKVSEAKANKQYQQDFEEMQRAIIKAFANLMHEVISTEQTSLSKHHIEIQSAVEHLKLRNTVTGAYAKIFATNSKEDHHYEENGFFRGTILVEHKSDSVEIGRYSLRLNTSLLSDQKYMNQELAQKFDRSTLRHWLYEGLQRGNVIS
jgi:hypothetical protein